MKKTLVAAALTFVTAFGVVAYARFAEAQAVDAGTLAQAPGVTVIPPMVDAGAGSDVATPTPTAAAPSATLTPQAEDIGVLTKLWKNGAFFSLAIIAIYIGLVAWSKLDKKHAFYAATGAAGLMTLVEAIRKGDAPTMTAVMSMLTTTTGVMIAGPGHTPAGK